MTIPNDPLHSFRELEAFAQLGTALVKATVAKEGKEAKMNKVLNLAITLFLFLKGYRCPTKTHGERTNIDMHVNVRDLTEEYRVCVILPNNKKLCTPVKSEEEASKLMQSLRRLYRNRSLFVCDERRYATRWK